jgi:bifunctional non-homologous end joining protein LigD
LDQEPERLDGEVSGRRQGGKNAALKSAILDGEIVAFGSVGAREFSKAATVDQQGGFRSDLSYLRFDLYRRFQPHSTPLRERKRVLAELLEPLGDVGVLRYSDHIEGNGMQFFKEACKLGLEGIVSKLARSAYESTRSRNWLKIKCIRAAGVCDRRLHLSDKGIPFSSLILGVYDKGKLIYAGRAGTGFSNAMRVELKKKARSHRAPRGLLPRYQKTLVCAGVGRSRSSSAKLRLPSGRMRA